MTERTVMALSERDALALANDLINAACGKGSVGDVQVMVEHWPSERSTVAVKGPRTWGPPIDCSDYRREDDFPWRPEHEAELERHQFVASKRSRCESGPDSA